jgi:hypothetical protein
MLRLLYIAETNAQAEDMLSRYRQGTGAAYCMTQAVKDASVELPRVAQAGGMAMT